MTHHRWTDRLCGCIMLLALLGTSLLVRGAAPGSASVQPGYSNRLFDDSVVHHIDVLIDPVVFDEMIDAASEVYERCAVRIDGEKWADVGIRVKGNNSRNLTQKYGSDRHSLKIRFDHYVDGRTYHGLEKLSLSASFQDNAYLKDFMAFDMMRFMGVPAPLTSYAFVTVNGEDWGLYVAIEEIGPAFARRNFGSGHGFLYKPDYKRLEDDNEDVALIYIGDHEQDYDNIFRNEVMKTGPEDRRRLIQALKRLATGEELDAVVNLETLLPYFAVQVFVVNYDSYLGPTGHNYFLYEEDGVLSMLPWDYNLAFGTYALGMKNPITDPTTLVNSPIDTPFTGDIMRNRPLYHLTMKQCDAFDRYHRAMDDFLSGYMESGHFDRRVEEISKMIDPYVLKDPRRCVSYEKTLLAKETFKAFCNLRAQSARAQLNGQIPSTFAARENQTYKPIDASSLRIGDMGEIDDLKVNS